MQTLTIRKKDACSGVVSIPSSKSYIHRFLFSALLADGVSVVENVSLSDDVKATLSCIEALGAKVTLSDDRRTVTVCGGIKKTESALLNCNECGSTLRFVIPIAVVLCGSARFTGGGKLMERPLEQYFKIFDDNGIDYTFEKGRYLDVSGDFKKSVYHIDGSVSSQFVTGMLYALALSENGGEIVIDGILQSKPYVDITLEVLSRSGIEVENHGYERFTVRGGQSFKSGHFRACGDWSQAAFFLTAGAISGKVGVKNIDFSSHQGDAVIVDILKKMGAKITQTANGVFAEKSELKAIGGINAENFPDIVPVLSLACALAEGTSRIYGIERLRYKECDRVEAVMALISKLGGKISLTDNSLVIEGMRSLCGGVADSFNDHRIAMTASVASLACEGEVTIKDPWCINKSYPDFYEDLLSTGGVMYEWNVGQCD